MFKERFNGRNGGRLSSSRNLRMVMFCILIYRWSPITLT